MQIKNILTVRQGFEKLVPAGHSLSTYRIFLLGFEFAKSLLQQDTKALEEEIKELKSRLTKARKEVTADLFNNGWLPPVKQTPVAYLFTHVQSGYEEASTDPDAHTDDSEYWFREPLVRANSTKK